MPNWLWVLLLIIVVLVVVLFLAWWAQTQQRTTSVAARGAPTPAPSAASAAGPYGTGSAAPLSDGSAPAGYAIKGNADSMLYHTPESPYYERTKAEAWFLTEADAVRAGFQRWDANRPG